MNNSKIFSFLLAINSKVINQNKDIKNHVQNLQIYHFF